MQLCENEKIRSDTNKISSFIHTYSKCAHDSGEPFKMIVGKGSQKPRYNSAALHQVFTVISLNTVLYGAICSGEKSEYVTPVN